MHSSQRELYSFVSSIPETLELLEEVGRPSVGVMVDTYHLWDTPTVLDDVARHVDRITGVHVADFRDPPRSSGDRVLPGDGVADLPRLLRALARRRLGRLLRRRDLLRRRPRRLALGPRPGRVRAPRGRRASNVAPDPAR